ncbi:MAG: hypothetical protein WCF30_09305 [Terracidiphilus sp.]
MEGNHELKQQGLLKVRSLQIFKQMEAAKAQTASPRDIGRAHRVKNAIEEVREYDSSVCNRRRVEMMTEIDQLMQNSLSEARSVIEGGGTWEPLVHIVHSQGVHSMRVPRLHAGLAEEAKMVDEINQQLDVLNGELLITVSDVWIGEDTPDGFVAISWGIPFSGRRKALLVQVEACCDRLTCGMQKYMRCADGQVLFGELCWGDPLEYSEFRLRAGICDPTGKPGL